MKEYRYQIGDWIFHLKHGVGQIKRKEQKFLDGKNSDFYKVSTFAGMYWLPTEEDDPTETRPAANAEEADEALSLMGEAPQELPQALKAREKEIERVRQNISLRAKAKLIRDMHGENKRKRISPGEELFLFKFKKEFINELSIAKNETPKAAEEIMEKALALSVSQG